MAKKNKTSKSQNMDRVYSYIVVNHTKRAGISLLVIAVTIALGTFIYANLFYNVHWVLWALPACGLASILLLAPISEDWNYQPWQKFPQQIEHHHNE